MNTPPGLVLWLTGLPSSGKSTIARLLCQRLQEQGLTVQILDSDDLRHTFTPVPTYSLAERNWFYGIIVYLAALLADNGVNVVIAATASRSAYRQAARDRLPRFAEIHVHCPAAVCRQRDPKGLWHKVQSGAIRGLPGADELYEAPLQPEAFVDSSLTTPDEAASLILQQLQQAGLLNLDQWPTSSQTNGR